MSESTAYIHGASPEEQARLELMNALLNERCLRELDVQPGMRVLEMGAGTGIFAAELAAAVGPTGHVVAIERDPQQLAEAQRRASGIDWLEVRAGDAYEPPLEAGELGRFDLAHARFLLEHVERPTDVVRAMVMSVAPGGRVALVDDDHSLMRFDPDPGAMSRLWFDYAEQYARLGNDPYVGRRLVSLLVEAGATPTRTTQVDYGACAGEPEFEGVARNLAEVVGGARATVLSGTDWTASTFDTAIADFNEWSRGPGATIWYALPLAIGRR